MYLLSLYGDVGSSRTMQSVVLVIAAALAVLLLALAINASGVRELVSVTSDELRELFAQYGSVTSASVISDRDTGRSRGFGFVEMADGGDAAIDALNGQDLQGRPLTVNEAKPREPRRSGGGGGYGRRERY